MTTLEGTWEEIASQAARLAGKRVRLTILEDTPSGAPDSPPAALRDPLAETGLQFAQASQFRTILDQVFTSMGVDIAAPAPSAKDVQQRMLREGVRAEDNLGSRAIIKAREE
jgi:hypothetical protein